MTKMNAFIFLRLPLLGFFLILSSGAFARTSLYVDGLHGSDNNNCKTRQTACKTIGHAVSVASPGNVILVGPATYPENLTINFNLGIIGSGASTTTIDGQGLNGVVNIPNQSTKVVLSGLTVRNGKADGCGGGIFNFGLATIYDSTITGNIDYDDFGDADGGGICNYGKLTISHTTVSKNQTFNAYDAYGSGICNFGELWVNESTITGNSSATTDTFGAGIFNYGTLVLNRSTISGNFTGGGATTQGGGIGNLGSLTINNSTIYGNSSEFFGGGVSNETNGVVTINNSTISGNSAGYQHGGGGGIYNQGTTTIQDSIIANNSGGNCNGTIASNGYNLSSDNTCNLNGPGDFNSIDPKLGNLGNYGGPTQTIPLLTGSPGIDAGNPNGCTDNNGHPLVTDQRGAPRPDKEDSGGCDIGAFERQSD